jgi:hypothetical protein
VCSVGSTLDYLDSCAPSGAREGRPSSCTMPGLVLERSELTISRTASSKCLPTLSSRWSDPPYGSLPSVSPARDLPPGPNWQVTSCTRLPFEHHAYPVGATWGLVMVLSGLVHNFEGAMAARFFLGVAEAGMSIEPQCSVVRSRAPKSPWSDMQDSFPLHYRSSATGTRASSCRAVSRPFT